MNLTQRESAALRSTMHDNHRCYSIGGVDFVLHDAEPHVGAVISGSGSEPMPKASAETLAEPAGAIASRHSSSSIVALCGLSNESSTIEAKPLMPE